MHQSGLGRICFATESPCHRSGYRLSRASSLSQCRGRSPAVTSSLSLGESLSAWGCHRSCHRSRRHSLAPPLSWAQPQCHTRLRLSPCLVHWVPPKQDSVGRQGRGVRQDTASCIPFNNRGLTWFSTRKLIPPLLENVKAGNRLDGCAGRIVERRRIVVRIARGYPGGRT